MVDKSTKRLDKGDLIFCVFFDSSKAFDTVHNDILVRKLSYYGIRDNALVWFQSYLVNRKQLATPSVVHVWLHYIINLLILIIFIVIGEMPVKSVCQTTSFQTKVVRSNLL